MKKRGTFKEILDNQYTKPLLFFGFYFFFFLFLFSFINIDKIDINEENKNSWKNINNNYKERIIPYNILENKSWVTSVRGRNGTMFDEYLDNIYNNKFVVSTNNVFVFF